MKRQCDIKMELYRDFRAAARRVLLRDGDMPLADLCRKTIDSGAPRWYVSESECARRLSRIARRGTGYIHNPYSRRMYADIHERADFLMRWGVCRNYTDAAKEVLSTPAPSFYISQRTAIRILTTRKYERD